MTCNVLSCKHVVKNVKYKHVFGRHCSLLYGRSRLRKKRIRRFPETIIDPKQRAIIRPRESLNPWFTYQSCFTREGGRQVHNQKVHTLKTRYRQTANLKIGFRKTYSTWNVKLVGLTCIERCDIWTPHPWQINFSCIILHLRIEWKLCTEKSYGSGKS